MEKPHIWRFKTVNELRDLYSNDAYIFVYIEEKIDFTLVLLPKVDGAIGNGP